MILVVKEERSVNKMPRQKSGNGRRALATNIRKCKKFKLDGTAVFSIT